MSAIALDVTPAITGATGIARYVTELHARLVGVPDVAVRAFAVGRGDHPAPPGARHIRTPLRVVDAAWRHLRRPRVEQIVGPIASVHASGSSLPPSNAPVVAVVHDLAALDHPDLHPARDVAQLRRYVASLSSAAAVIAVSETTARRLAQEADPTRIHVVPQGRATLPPMEEPPLSGRPYLLAVGAAVPRKGYDLIVRALPALGDVHLALVGPAGSEDQALEDLAAALGVSARVHRIGRVTDAQLAGWYARAAALVAPSVEEGFGLPLVEALGAGTPVVATDLPVHREVSGGGALLVDPGDVDGLTAALRTALDAGPDVRRLVADGSRHVERYTWDACAASTLEIHRALW